ncbi:hypothetical protein PLICRDRAFT_53631 [Plicaturopsis crispa FD-325 SS-3]|nr:hypothetical protein PLICRDRAFT_53631 [Plicaturopsis crispa FD-325 SS-3]
MAQLLRPTPSQPPGRISQLLPTVKCSNCNNPVQLADLGEHVCPLIPPVPVKTRPPSSPRSITGLLPTRLQNLVPGRSSSTSPQDPKQHHGSALSNSPPSRAGSPNLQPPANRPGWNLSQRAPSPLSASRNRQGPTSPTHSMSSRTPSMSSTYTTSTITQTSNPRSTTSGPARPSYDARRPSYTESRPSMSSSRPSYDAPRPSRDSARPTPNAPPPRPSYDLPRPSYESSRPRQDSAPSPRPRQNSTASTMPRQRQDSEPAYVARTGNISPVPPLPAQDDPIDRGRSVTPVRPEPDTKIGGEAGMAGVGRRGFAAAARVAMFAAGPSVGRGGFLDIGAAVGASNTPPLSPNSPGSGYSSHSYSPDPSPGPHSPASPAFPPVGRRSPGLSVHVPDYSKVSEPAVRSPEIGSDSEYGGLAYADDDESQYEDSIPPGSPPIKSAPIPTSPPNSGGVRFPTVDDRDTGRMRKNSVASSSDYTKSSTDSYIQAYGNYDLGSKSSLNGKGKNKGLDRSASERPNVPGQRSQTLPGQAMSPTSPTSPPPVPSTPKRSLTVPTHIREKVKRECVRCERRIEDGRWIQMDSGVVMCERCWKNMYLPKCRRCNLPIEKQAVSSSDGQLKGKYHRECFNCHSCHKPFPDKTFYVFDGKPLCAYHYHEANNSLCAAPDCGAPIEGPCAVAHSGARFHPAHLTCEHSGCRVRLEEYWEVDGRMLCERHAGMGGSVSGDSISSGLGVGARPGARERLAAEGRATKRVTMFIDLGELGGSGLR